MRCHRCSEIHERCAGHQKHTGQPCRAHPVRGHERCRMHLGKKASVARAETEAAGALRRALDAADAPPVTDPVTALQELAGRVKYALDAMGERVNQLTEMRYESLGQSTEQLRAEVAVWERLIGRLHPLLVDMTRLGLEERLTRVTEAQGAAIVEVLRAAAEELGMDVADEQVRTVVSRHLRSVPGGKAA